MRKYKEEPPRRGRHSRLIRKRNAAMKIGRRDQGVPDTRIFAGNITAIKLYAPITTLRKYDADFSLRDDDDKIEK